MSEPNFNAGGTADLPPEPKPTDPSGAADPEGEDAPESRSERLHAMADHAEERINHRMQSTGERLGRSAERIGRLADERLTERGGVAALGGQMVQTVADLLECGARYLRDNDVDTLRTSLQRQLRDRPLQTLAVVAVAGWITGKALR